MFTLGTGCANDDLIPEVTGICDECALKHYERFKSEDDCKIRDINITVFKKQVEDNFSKPESLLEQVLELKATPGKILERPETDKCTNIEEVNPFGSDEEETNPFGESTSCSESEEPFLDACEICCESFPSQEFVDLHKTIFHSSSVVKTMFVDEAEALITSFVKAPESSVNDEGESEPVARRSGQEIEKVAKLSKYMLRKRLKY